MTGQDALSHPDGGSEFVGREPELETLANGLERARSGRGAMLLIGGEPGIGKSRLADEFAETARRAGTRVLWGRCWEGAGAPAYWPWMQALRSHLRAINPSMAREQLGSGAADIAQMLPEVRQLIPDLPPAPPDSDSARFRLFDSTASFLRNAGRDDAAVLVLDDLHAADVPSILLLRFLAGQLSDMRLVVVGTYRDVELTPGHPLAEAITDIAREPVSRLVSLKGLGEEAVGRFIESTAGLSPVARLVRGMWRETNGNPLFLGEAVRLLATEGDLAQAASSGSLRLSVPAGVREVIARRVRQLSEPTVRALTVAAGLGPEFSVETLRRVQQDEDGDVGALLEEAVRAGLLTTVRGSAGRLRFAHDLMRESVYQDQPPADRAALHRRIGYALEKQHRAALDPRLPELAHHFFEAAQVGLDDPASAEVRRVRAKASEYTRRAGERAAAALAYEEAARLYRMALAVIELDDPPDEHLRAELLLAMGDAQARAGEMESANDSFVRAADVARRTGVAAHLGRAALGVGGRLPWARSGKNPHLIPLLQEALMLLGGGDDRLRVRLLARLASAWRSDPERQQQSDTMSREAVELARRLDDPATLSYALAARYWATWWPDNPDERLLLAKEMIAVSEAVRDDERMVDARLMLWLSHSEAGRMVEAALELNEIRRVAEELRQPAQLWLGVAPPALMALMVGEFEQAEELIERELEPGPPTTPARDNESIGRFHAFLLRRETGGLAEVEDLVRAAIDDFPWYPIHRAALVLLLIRLGRAAEARQVFDALAGDRFAALYRDNEWLLGMCMTSEACALLGEEAAAGVLYEQLAPFAGRHAIGHAEGSVGAVDRYLGLLAATTGRLDDAVRHIEDGIRINEQMGARPWAAHSQHDLAEVLGRRGGAGDAERAAELERAALATARQLGMTALAERIGEMPEAEPSTEPVAATGPSAASFRREGEYWTIAFDGDSFRLRDGKGLRYLARLLAQPGREMLALDLAREAGPAGRSSVAAAETDLRPTDFGTAGPQLDDEARAAYRARLRELQEELDEAESWNDPERADRAREEMDFLARELSRAVGLGGRERATGSASERARLSVTRAIRLAMARIADNSPSLGAHLETAIHTGTYCAYRPDPRLPIAWDA